MNLDYVAGFFDGEACFTISIQVKKTIWGFPIQFNPRITITQSEESNEVLEKMQAFLGMGHVYYHKRSKPSKNGRVVKEINFRIYPREDLKKLINLLEDKIIVKLPQLRKFWKVLELMKNVEENWREIAQIADEINPRRTIARKWTIEEIEKIVAEWKQGSRLPLGTVPSTSSH